MLQPSTILVALHWTCSSMSVTSLYWRAKKRPQLSRTLLCHSLSLGIYKRFFGENQKACLMPSILSPKRAENVRSEKNYKEESQCRMTLFPVMPHQPFFLSQFNLFFVSCDQHMLDAFSVHTSPAGFQLWGCPDRLRAYPCDAPAGEQRCGACGVVSGACWSSAFFLGSVWGYGSAHRGHEMFAN